MDYGEIPPSTRGQLAAALMSGDTTEIIRRLLGVAMNDPDGEWVQNKCLELLGVDDIRIQRAALLGLSHVARLHRRLDVERVQAAVMEVASIPELAGYAEEALEDVVLFAGRQP